MSIAQRFQDIRQFELCLQGGRMTRGGFDTDGNLRVDEPNDPAAVVAIQQALADLGYDIGVDGGYGRQTDSVVQQFKNDQHLDLPPGLSTHDGVTGPGTSNRLNELFADDLTGLSSVRLINEFGEALPGVVVEASDTQDGDRMRQATTDADGTAQMDTGGPWKVTLEPMSALGALGDLLDRPWPPSDQPQSPFLVTTLFTDLEVTVSPGESAAVVVASRLQYSASLPVPIAGEVRIEGDGVRVTHSETEVTVALQANGGFPATVSIDPIPAEGEPPPLPEATGWELPNGYIVREGDTEESLSELFLHQPDRFDELSDHPPVPGETIILPDEAVPDWLSLATEPPPPAPTPLEWFQVTPDDLIRTFYTGDNPAAIHSLLEAITNPPIPDPHPVVVMAERAETLALLLAAPEVLGPEPEVPIDELDGLLA